MKKIFIPKGQTVTYAYLNTDCVIVKGTLRISGKLVAKAIVGGGIVEAREIICDDMRVYSATADFITARKIAADKLFVQFECRAAEQIAVRDYFTAGYVSTGTLSVSLSDVGSCDADEIITVQQCGSLLGLLWVSWWRSLLLNLFHSQPEKAEKEKKEMSVPKPQNKQPVSELAPNPVLVPENAPDSDTIDLLIAVLSDLKTKGYQVSRSKPVTAVPTEKADAA